jgi:endonuclease/exonuclease/phosphatase family metal-dependent hydrolase
VTTLTVASLNTRGIPPFGTHLRDRYAAIGTVLESSDVDVVNFQEVLTDYHLRQLARSMPSYRSVSFRRSLGGPAGGLVTLSRIPVDDNSYLRFPTPSAAESAGVPCLYRLLAPLQGTLATRLSGVTILNTHLLANRDGDWSETNRFHRLQEAQLVELGRFVARVPQPAIVSGDFNVSRHSSLYRDFIHRTALIDAFGDDCPPTFHAAYLPPDKSPHCIDFLLLSDASITVESAVLTFTGKLPLPGGPDYLTDHLGLQVRLAI